jgi:hypothetical protein
LESTPGDLIGRIVSKSTKSKSSRQISKAELKAYQTRRAEEGQRIAVPSAQNEAVTSAVVRHAYTMTRDEEYAVIRSDLRRLLIIVGILLAFLVVATVLLR